MERPHIQGLSEWRPLARGGLADVWQARQWPLNRLVAVKVCQRELSQDDRRRFLREAAAAGRLSAHRGVVTAHGAGILPDNRPYLIMELCSGGSLTQWLHPENRLPVERVRQIGVRIAEALAALHACGVLHCDVKPANILIDDYGNPRLADFGLAAAIGTEAGTAEAMWLTPAYAPPEALRWQSATEAGDVFSLAATLYALLTGSPPDCGAAAPVVVEPAAELATSPIQLSAEVDDRFKDVLMAALSPDPGARPTAAAFRDRLAQVPSPAIPARVTVGPGGSISVPGGGSVALAATRATERSPAEVVPAAARHRRARPAAMFGLAAAVVTVVAATTVWVVRDPGAPSAISGELPPSADPSQASDSGRSTSRAGSGAGRHTDSDSRTQEAISVSPSAGSARPYQTVPISGTYRGGSDALLRVQRWEQGRWRAFPLPAKTDQSGQFTAYVELGQPSRYRLRVLNPDSGVASEPFVLSIKG